MTKIGHDETVTLNREVKANHLYVSIFHHILSSRLQACVLIRFIMQIITTVSAGRMAMMKQNC